MNRSIELTRQERKAKYWWSPFLWAALFIIVVPMIVMPIIMIAVMMLFGSLVDFESVDSVVASPIFVLLNLATFPFVLLATLLIGKYVEKRSMQSFGFFKQNMPIKYLFGAIIGILANLLVFLIVLLAGGLSTEFNPNYNGLMIFLLLLGFMVQGMTEEVICRGFIMNAVAAKKGIVFAVISNSLFFALLHGMNPGMTWLPMLNIFIFGIVFSLLFYYTDNMWLTGAAHSLWNFFMGAILGIQVSGQPIDGPLLHTVTAENMDLINGGVFGLEGGIVVTILGLMWIMALLFASKKKYQHAVEV